MNLGVVNPGSMYHVILVALGGAVGAVSRYKIGEFFSAKCPLGQFPVGTWMVNLIGCLLAGLLLRLAQSTELFTHDLRLVVFTGVLGGFTTFSAFGVESVLLIKRGEFGIAALYVISSIACGMAAVWLGLGRTVP